MPNTGVMASLPKPLIALLVATVAVFALWTAVLKKTVTGGGSSSSNSPSAPALTSAIAKAHQAVTTANQASVAHGGTVSTTPAPASAKPAAAQAAKPSAKDTQKAVATLKALAKGTVSVNAVVKAIDSHKVVALLFYNPAAADDQAVRQELNGVSTHRGQVAKFAVPVTDLSQFQPVTSRVPVESSPTLLVIDKQGATTALTGFVDQLAISQRVADALAAK
jgi:hypothetical protein